MSNRLEIHLTWFSEVVNTAIQLYFRQDCVYQSIEDITTPEDQILEEIIPLYNFSLLEKIVIWLAIVPHIRPQLLDIFFVHNKDFDRPFTEFGGLKGNNHCGFIPTGETAAFVVGHEDLNKRLEIQQLFNDQHIFSEQNLLGIQQVENKEPFLSGALQVSEEFFSQLLTHKKYQPSYSIHFPAKKETTLLNWEDLILPYSSYSELEDINTWIQSAETIMTNTHLSKYIKPGYRALFYGPSGTGKTLSANLLGKRNHMDVYRIDLSLLVSKYIGETEKNLAQVFNQAESKRWILFFDEADALFGKRSQTNSSNDRHANQEVAYLLQRIEDFPGIVVVATNLRSNIDEAFSRRFQSAIYFPVPEYEQRLILWKNMLPPNWLKGSDINLDNIARQYELTGGTIINIIRYCALQLISDNQETLTSKILIEGIKKELRKEGKTL